MDNTLFSERGGLENQTSLLVDLMLKYPYLELSSQIVLTR